MVCLFSLVLRCLFFFSSFSSSFFLLILSTTLSILFLVLVSWPHRQQTGSRQQNRKWRPPIFVCFSKFFFFVLKSDRNEPATGSLSRFLSNLRVQWHLEFGTTPSRNRLTSITIIEARCDYPSGRFSRLIQNSTSRWVAARANLAEISSKDRERGRECPVRWSYSLLGVRVLHWQSPEIS